MAFLHAKFKNPNFKPNDFTLFSAAVRICPTLACIEAMNKKIRSSKSYMEKSNITELQKVDMAYVEDDDKKVLKRVFKNVDFELY